MGTNYYAYTDVCECCGRGDEEIHIGKSSAGWCFSLCVNHDLNIYSLSGWKEYLKDKSIVIRDEYGVEISRKQLYDVIEIRSWDNDFKSEPFGYDSWGVFHDCNGSEPGINGLLRHRIGSHCIAHGEGTWDMIDGEFS